MNTFDRKYKALLMRYNELKRTSTLKDKELGSLRHSLRKHNYEEAKPSADLITNIKAYLESELGIDLSARTRRQEYIKGRCMFYHFARRYTELTLQQIAQLVGGLDHSTIIHGLVICEDYIKQSKSFAKDMIRHDDYILNTLINPQVDSVESINAEIQVLKEKLNKLSPSESKNIIFELC